MNEYEKVILQLASKYSDPDGFVSFFEKVAAILPPSQKADAFYDVGVTLNDLSYFVLALHSWNKALTCFTEIGDRAGESACYTNIGSAYFNLGDFRRAIELYEKSLQIAKEIGFSVGESKSYAGLGNASLNLGDFRRAIEYHEKSLQIDKERGDRAGELGCCGNLGTAYSGLGDIGRAEGFYKKALQIGKKLGEIEGERISNLDIANFYYDSHPKAGYNYCRRSIELSEKIGGKLVEEYHKRSF